MDDGFEHQNLLSHEFAGVGQFSVPIDARSVLIVGGRVSRTWTTPDDFTTTRVAGTIAWELQVGTRFDLTAGAVLSYEVYDNYFEDFTRVSRHEWNIHPFLSLDYRITPNMEISLLMEFGHNESNVDTADYDALDFTPSLALNFRF